MICKQIPAGAEQGTLCADVMKVMIWHTPQGIIDEGGKMLEGYINFNITLMSPPENDHMNVSASLKPSLCDFISLHAGSWCSWGCSVQHLQCPA